jgi:hypothetical protein
VVYDQDDISLDEDGKSDKCGGAFTVIATNVKMLALAYVGGASTD